MSARSKKPDKLNELMNELNKDSILPSTLASTLPSTTSNETTFFNEVWTDADFKKVIRKMNLKVTPQRLLILKELHKEKRHITAQELFEKLNKNYPDLGFATIYRFLKSMAEKQIVTEVRMGGLPARYELTPKQHHDHMTCILCERIVEFENKNIENLQEKIAQQFGFKLTHHVLELYGICPTCQNLKSKQE